MASYQVMVFTAQGAMKDGINLDTTIPEDCLNLVKLIVATGDVQKMAEIPTADKERLFDWLNDEAAFPQERYTRRIEEIHEILAMDLKD